MKEIDLAKRVIAYLQDLQWDVYQEVQIFNGGAIADIVGVQGPITWVIETKMTLSLALIGQAHEWTHLANYVSVAVPWGKRHSLFGEFILKHFGIGLLRISTQDNLFEWEERVRESIHPIFRRKVGYHLRSGLNDRHKTYAEAGNNEGRRWSPFKETCLQVHRYVTMNEGCAVKELINSISHHYASNSTARICIPRWAEAGKIEGVRVVKENGKWKFYTNQIP